MLAIDRRAVLKAADATGWDLEGHIQRVYDTFRFRGVRPPALVVRPGELRPAIHQSLMDWKADLGARDRMDWPGFLAGHGRILQPLATLPRLGLLDARAIDEVCAVVARLEQFKATSGRALVFGSKAAHFHFPGLVPVVSSEVAAGLQEIERRHPDDIARLVAGTGRRFVFTNAANRQISYRNYVVLGNALTAGLDSQAFFGRRSSARYDLHSKIFEWWVIGTGWA